MKMTIDLDPGGITGRKRVLLVDHYSTSRSAASAWLRQTSDLTVCGESNSEHTTLEAIERLLPDVLVMEIPLQQEMEFVQTLRDRYPGLPILVYSFRNEETYAPLALEAGADGYLMKGGSPCTLMNGIRAVLDGRVAISQSLRAKLLAKCLPPRRPVAPIKDRPSCRPAGPVRNPRAASRFGPALKDGGNI